MNAFYASYGLGLLVGFGTMLAHAYVLMRLGFSPALLLPLMMFLGYESAQPAADKKPAAAVAPAPLEVTPRAPDAPQAPPPGRQR